MWPTEATSQQHSCLCMWWQFELGSVSTADTCQTVRKGKYQKLVSLMVLHLPKMWQLPCWRGRPQRNSKCHSKECSPWACPGKTKVKNETQPWVPIMYGARPVSFCPVSYSLGPRHLAICQPWPGGMNEAARQRLQKGGGRKRQGCRNRRRERSEERKEMRQKKG